MKDVSPEVAKRIERAGLRAFERAHAIERGEVWPRVMRAYDRIVIVGMGALAAMQLFAVARLVF